MDDNVKQTKQDLKILNWKQLIEDFNNSGISLSEWCDLNHVARSTYYKYLRLIRNDLLVETSSSKPIELKQTFVPISRNVQKIEPITITKGSIQIQLTTMMI